MIRNWYFWMILTGSLMVLGALVEKFTEWPYLTYFGVFSFSGVILLWTALAIIKTFNK